jgi:flagellar export protein FliJ
MQRSALEQLLESARKARDEAGRQLADERMGQQQLLTHIELLSTYRLEYSLQLQQAMQNGMPLTALRDFQAFLASLDQALAQGQHSLSVKEDRLQKAQMHWRLAQQRLDTFTALQKRQQQAVAKAEGRREQRGNDELSSQFAARERTKQARLSQEAP